MPDQFQSGKTISHLFDNFYIIYIHQDNQMKIVNTDTNEILFNINLTFDSILEFQEKVNELKKIFMLMAKTGNKQDKDFNEIFRQLEINNLQLFEIKIKQLNLLKSLKFKEKKTNEFLDI